jgi:hypothetical protein
MPGMMIDLTPSPCRCTNLADVLMHLRHSQLTQPSLATACNTTACNEAQEALRPLAQQEARRFKGASHLRHASKKEDRLDSLT